MSEDVINIKPESIPSLQGNEKITQDEKRLRKALEKWITSASGTLKSIQKSIQSIFLCHYIPITPKVQKS
jgi:hypothetical protein